MNYIKRIPFWIRREYDRAFLKRNFTIISNNCWGGKLYQYMKMPYLSPIVGLYMYPNEYLKLIKDLKGYFSKELTFIKPEESKYYEQLKEKKQTNVPIGLLGDVELVFLHYLTKDEAYEKWKRRVARVNYDDIIFKFSQMNGCTEDHLKEFDSLEHNNKFMFVSTPNHGYKCGIYFTTDNGVGGGTDILVDTKDFPQAIKVKDVLKKKQEKYKL